MTQRELLGWLCCPLCKRDLAPAADAYRCTACARSYPIVLGIPDLRAYPDPHVVSVEDDYRKGAQVQEQASRLRFAELLEFYWQHVSTPPTPVSLRARFIRHVLEDEERAERLPLGDVHDDACLDVGCGASALPAVLCKRSDTVFATDIAFRWLVLQRKRLEEMGMTAALVCCCGDSLPFRDRTFALVTAVSLLEHVPKAGAIVTDCARVLRERGRFFAATTNRFSLAPEPHVRIWALGFLPRRWMPSVVRWRRGLAYDRFHLLSFARVRDMLGEAGFSNLRFSLPEVRPADLEGRGPTERAGGRVFQLISKVGLLRPLLLRLAPLVQVLATRRAAHDASRAA